MSGRDQGAHGTQLDRVPVDPVRPDWTWIGNESRYRALMIPSCRLVETPDGSTTHSRAVQSVSAAVVAAHRVTLTSPIRVISRPRGSEVYTSTIREASATCWSAGPIGVIVSKQQEWPPWLGVARAGS